MLSKCYIHLHVNLKMVLEANSTNKQTTTSSVDKYEKVVDLQNDCRSFYLNRVKATENLKQKLENKNGVCERKKTSMSMAMDRLRLEMVCSDFGYFHYQLYYSIAFTFEYVYIYCYLETAFNLFR